LNFLGRFFENTQIWNLLTIRPAGAEFHEDGRTDGQTDLTKPVVAFSKIAKSAWKQRCRK